MEDTNAQNVQPVKLQTPKEGGCFHEAFGITCERNAQIAEEIQAMLKLCSDKHVNKSRTIQNMINIGQTRNEQLFIVYQLGRISDGMDMLWMVNELEDTFKKNEKAVSFE